MQPLGLSAMTWGWIAVLATAVFLAVLVPPMPTRKHRVSTALAPVVMALFGYASYAVKHLDGASVLVMYSATVLVFPVGMIGHRRELARRLREAQRTGASEDETWPAAMVVQFLVSAAVCCGVVLWITG